MNQVLEHKPELILKRHNISPSIHRVMILDYLMQNDVHPTVQSIFSELIGKIPTLSKTTIYNVLNLLKKSGLVKELLIEGTEIRYDHIVEPHAHFKCLECDSVYNIDHQCDMFKMNYVNEHLIEMCQINFMGTCKDCLNG